MSRTRAAAGALLGALLSACSTQRPVLYPNAHLEHVGPQVAQLDIDRCMRRAEQFTTGDRGAAARDTATSTATGAATGGAAGAVGGAITGNAGEGAAVGAAAGATYGLLGGLFRGWTRREPPSTYRAFVERCLRERGYDPIGWE
jgi:hypothetical protein